MSKDGKQWENENKHNSAHSFLLAQDCTFHILNSAEVWLASGPVDSVVSGVECAKAKPLLLYSGGSWITDAAKAFLKHEPPRRGHPLRLNAVGRGKSAFPYYYGLHQPMDQKPAKKRLAVEQPCGHPGKISRSNRKRVRSQSSGVKLASKYI